MPVVDRAINEILRLAGWVVAAVLAAMVVVTIIQVTWRLTAGGGFYWAEELARYCFVWVVFIGSAIAFHRGLHIGVDMLTVMAGPRLQAALALFVEALIIAFCGIVIYASVPVLEVNALQISPGLGVQMSLVYSAIPISMALTALLSLVRVAKILQGDRDAMSGQKGIEL